MTIKHLVISGGGPTGIKALGALKYLHEQSYWNINDIQSIYATSAGALIAVLIMLKFDMDTISNYILNRPWHEAYPINISQFFDIYKNKGLYNKVTEIFFKPFFESKDLSLTMTMKELFEYTKIDLHVFSLEINKFIIEDISWKTHPELNVFTAIHMSIALPIIISPVCINDKCYIDGGIISNYPLEYCLKQDPSPNINEILGLRKAHLDENIQINTESTILDFLIHFINKLMLQVSTETTQTSIPNEVIYPSYNVSLKMLSDGLFSASIRAELLNNGIESAKELLLNSSL